MLDWLSRFLIRTRYRWLLNEAVGNARIQYMMGGDDADAALVQCLKSITTTDSVIHALYVGAYMATIARLTKGTP